MERNEGEANERVFLRLALAGREEGEENLDEDGQHRLLASHCQKGGGEEVSGAIQVDGGAEVGELLGA